MDNVVDFKMIVEINEILKSKGIEYSIHSVGSCACCGLLLQQNGKDHSIKDIIDIINDYLSSQWLKVKQNEYNEQMLDVQSKFNSDKN